MSAGERVCRKESRKADDLGGEQESKEAYFVALRRKPDVPREAVFPDEVVGEENEFPE